MEVAAATNPRNMRGARSLAAYLVCTVSCVITSTPPPRISSPYRDAANARFLVHSSPMGPLLATSGVCSRVLPSRVRSGCAACPTRPPSRPPIASHSILGTLRGFPPTPPQSRGSHHCAGVSGSMPGGPPGGVPVPGAFDGAGVAPGVEGAEELEGTPGGVPVGVEGGGVVEGAAGVVGGGVGIGSRGGAATAGRVDVGAADAGFAAARRAAPTTRSIAARVRSPAQRRGPARPAAPGRASVRCPPAVIARGRGAGGPSRPGCRARAWRRVAVPRDRWWARGRRRSTAGWRGSRVPGPPGRNRWRRL